MIVFALLFMALPLVFMGIGVFQLHHESRLLHVAVPVPAHIDACWIGVDHGSKRNMYKPAATYSYIMNGQGYRGSAVAVLDSSGSYAWAKGIMDHFHSNTDVSAYCDPNDPTVVFLYHEAETWPYIFLLLPLVHFSVGLLIALCTRPDYPGATRRRVQIVAAVWTVAAVTVGVHGVIVLKAHDLMLVILEGCATAIALGLWYCSTRWPRADPVAAQADREADNPYRQAR